MTQPSLFSRLPTRQQAARRRDAALRQTDPAWVRLAAASVTTWAWQTHADRTPWLLEDARRAYEDAGLPAPRDPRWWGEVSQTLRRQGVIVADGWGAACSSNGSAKRRWRLR